MNFTNETLTLNELASVKGGNGTDCPTTKSDDKGEVESGGFATDHTYEHDILGQKKNKDYPNLPK